MDSDVDSEQRSDFTSYLEHISQKKVSTKTLFIVFIILIMIVT